MRPFLPVGALVVFCSLACANSEKSRTGHEGTWIGECDMPDRPFAFEIELEDKDGFCGENLGCQPSMPALNGTGTMFINNGDSGYPIELSWYVCQEKDGCINQDGEPMEENEVLWVGSPPGEDYDTYHVWFFGLPDPKDDKALVGTCTYKDAGFPEIGDGVFVQEKAL